MKRIIYPLCAAADEARAKPILEALKAKGAALRDGTADPGKGDALLLFLSGNFRADGPEADAFFRLREGRELIIPVNLDGCTPPAELQSALMARHALDGRKYGVEELADLIARAAKGEGKNRLPLILSAAAAVILLVVGGVALWKNRSAQVAEAPAPEVTAAPTDAPTPAPTPAPTVDGIDVELTKVAEVVYVGDVFKYYKTTDGIGYSQFGTEAEIRSYYEVAYDDGTMRRFYSTETGREIPVAELGDVSYLAYLPNLMHVTFVNVKGRLPDLSSLKFLKSVTIINCDIPDIQGLEGSTISRFEYHGSSVTDFSPLSGCGKLNHMTLAPWNQQVDLSTLRLPALRWLSVCGKTASLDGLAASDRLQQVRLQDTYLTDLSFLQGKKLEELYLENNPQLTSLQGLQGMTTLRNLSVNNCLRLQDVSALEGCSSLTDVHIGADWGWMEHLTDVSVLGRLPRLWGIGLYAVNINDLNFLKDLKLKNSVSLGFCINRQADYSGLAAINSYNYLHVNTGGNYAAVAPYLEGKTVRQLMIYEGGLVDLSTLPKVTGELDLCRCRNRDLTGIPELSFSEKLWIQDCPYFSSFDGIENLSGFRWAGGTLAVENCPRLADWSGIEGKWFNRIEIKRMLSLPDLSTVTFNELVLGKLSEDVLPDLSCLNGISDSRNYNFRLEDLPQITDLSPLFRLHGYKLEVPPQVGEQARGLVEDGRFKAWEIVYPNGSWDPNAVEVQLLSLEELDTLPPSILKHVKRVTIVGDCLVDNDATEIRADWSRNPPVIVLTDRTSGEEFARISDPGTLFTDFSRLSVLTGLEDLDLWYQPLTSLDGIQVMENLRRLKAQFCPKLTDVSAAFTLQELREINFERCPVSSLQGIQNLYDLELLQMCNTKITSLAGIEGLKRLTMVRISGTDVKDFSPFAEVDFTYAGENGGGVQLDLNVMHARQLKEEDLAFLANVPGFSRLVMHQIPARLWLDCLMDKPVKELSSDDVGMTQEQFEAFVAAHPELEYVSVSWNQKITDASCLLGLENLRTVWLSRDMQKAIASLGEGFGFQLNLD